MTLRRRVAFVQQTSWPLLLLCLAAAVAVAVVFSRPLVFTVVIAVVFFVTFTHYAATILVRRAYRRLGRLIAANEYDAARALLDELRELYAAYPKQLAHLRLTEAALLSREGRTPKPMRSSNRSIAGTSPAFTSRTCSTAWRGRSPRANEAVPLARASLETSLDDPGELRGYQLGTLGSALALDGQARKA
jgi:hypothetical protein